MKKIQQPPDKTPLMLFQGDNYTLDVPRNWLITKTNEQNRIGFLGPRVGKSRTRFFIGEMPSMEPEKILNQQKQAEGIEQFELLETNDVSGSGFSAIMHRFCYFEARENMTIYCRQMFIDIDGRVLAMFSIVPNTPHLEAFDRLFTKMFSSFRVGQVVYTPLA